MNKTLLHLVLGAILLAPSLAAAAPPAAAPAEAKAPETTPAAPAPAEAKPAEATPAEAKPAEPPRPQARRILTPEEIKELPVFSRYDAATWDKMLQKGNALLEDVKDNTFGYDEEAFYWLVYHVNRLKPELLKPDDECVPYPSLVALPSSFRGQPVTITGMYMSAYKFRVPVLALQKDVPFLFECTVKEHPADQLRPVATVITSEDPTLYLHAGDDVRLKGYFYKVRAYQGTRGEGFAPMVIAQRLEPDEGPAPGGGLAGDAGRPRGGPFSDPYLVMMIAVVIILMIAFVAVRMQLRKPKSHAPRERPNQAHRFRLRRQDRIEPPGPGGGGSEGGVPKP
ncbi:MAG: hypothetical protein NTX87_12870 [Planctomycetota bacterium]|nr:hypothetical protein [Planctomycetota bacterium]